MEKESDALLSAEERIQQLTGLLLDKIARAVEELDVYTSVSKERKKETELNEKGKATGEIVTEKEHPRRYRDVVDRSALKQLTAALKDLKDIQLSLADDKEAVPSGIVEISALLEAAEGGSEHE